MEKAVPGGESTRSLLSRRQFWTILSCSVAVFLFSAGPVWRNAFEIDAHIFLSYLVIPILVFALAVQKRTFRFLSFVGVTFELALLKFFVTLVFAGLLWSYQEPPERRTESSTPVGERRALPRPTDLARDEIGDIRGVVDTQESDVWVYVDQKLDEFVFAPPSWPALLRYSGGSIEPSRVIANAYQDLRFSSREVGLHVLEARQSDGSHVFNLPMLSTPSMAPVKRYKRPGRYEFRCRVHEGESGEVVDALVLAHPFFSKIDEKGRFEIRNVPLGVRKLSVFGDESLSSETIELSSELAQVFFRKRGTRSERGAR